MYARLTFGRRPGTLRGANPLILKAFFASQVLDFKGYFFLAHRLLTARFVPANLFSFVKFFRILPNKQKH